MKKTVAKIVKSFTIQNRYPIAYAALDCGHSSDVKSINFIDMHHDANLLTKVGDEVECERCDWWYQKSLEKIKALAAAGAISHSRFRPNDSRGSADGTIYVYGRDPNSPSGVTMLASIESTKESNALLSSLGAGALSPTEKR